MAVKSLKRNIFQRMLGIPATGLPHDTDCWSFEEGTITVDLSRATELASTGTAIRLEGRDLPQRVLVVHGDDGNYYAFRNRCQHFGRRLDPVPDSGTVQCCSVNKATYDMQGNVVSGPAKRPVSLYPVQVEGQKLTVKLA